MKATVFVGPSLWDNRSDLGPAISLRPPAAQGDLYRAVRDKPHAIGLIDGAFETVPSVWHKEILFALSRGIHVYGAASMGALRAAELAPFGMKGVGTIFRDYRSGRIERDDEVAVLHAPAEQGYRPLSEALVDMRATLAKAVRARIASAKTARALEHIAAETFFKDRTWHRILRSGVAHGLPKRQLKDLLEWVSKNRVEQKGRDALLLIAALNKHLARKRVPFRPRFNFQRTEFWQAVVEDNGRA